MNRQIEAALPEVIAAPFRWKRIILSFFAGIVILATVTVSLIVYIKYSDKKTSKPEKENTNTGTGIYSHPKYPEYNKTVSALQDTLRNNFDSVIESLEPILPQDFTSLFGEAIGKNVKAQQKYIAKLGTYTLIDLDIRKEFYAEKGITLESAKEALSSAKKEYEEDLVSFRAAAEQERERH